jgi:hypothetical protein
MAEFFRLAIIVRTSRDWLPLHDFVGAKPAGGFPEQSLPSKSESHEFEVAWIKGQRFDAAQPSEQSIEQLQKNTVRNHKYLRPAVRVEQETAECFGPLPYVLEWFGSLRIHGVQIVSYLYQEDRGLQTSYLIPGKPFQDAKVAFRAQFAGDYRHILNKKPGCLNRSFQRRGDHHVETRLGQLGGSFAGFLDALLT